jgi:hypothetical protein
LLSLCFWVGAYGPPAVAAGPTLKEKAAAISVSQTLVPRPQELSNFLTYLSNTPTQQILSGQHSDDYAAYTSGTYGNLLDQFLPRTGATPANVSINNYTSATTSANSNLTPAILGVEINSAGTCGSSQTYAQTLALAQGWAAAGGIVQVTFGLPSPSQGICTFAGNGTEFPNVINNNGNATYNTYMYGQSSSGTPCTSSAPCGGVWAQAQAIKAISGTVIFRTLFESNLAQSSWWWGTDGTSGTSPTNAQFVTLFKQTISYMRSLGVANMLVVYNLNFGPAGGSYWSANDPGSSYRDLGGVDIYGPTTQASVISDLESTSGPVPYLQSLGIPLLLNEVGSSTGTPALYTYDNSIWDSGIRAGASHLVGTVVFDQNFCLSCQLNALGYLQGTITRSHLLALER